jgi:hypothetical protein
MTVSTEEFIAAVDDPMPAGDLMEFRFNVWVPVWTRRHNSPVKRASFPEIDSG